MKLVLSYLLVTIYATHLIKPVLPTATNILSHLFNYSHHHTAINKEPELYAHHEYVQPAEEDAPDQESATQNIRDTTDQEQIIPASQTSIFPVVYCPLYACIPTGHLSRVCRDTVFHPPGTLPQQY